MREPPEHGRDTSRGPRRVAVVIPARNEGDRIGHTVRTVLDQAMPGVTPEVIVVDDGSTDGTAGAAAAAGARVISVPAEASGSPGAARNRGARHSAGDPIVFLDAD